MKSHEAAVADAIAALTARLASWAVDEPAQKAHEYVHDMLRHGWRPRAARPIDEPPPKPQPADPETRQRAIEAARAALRPRHEETAHESDCEENGA